MQTPYPQQNRKRYLVIRNGRGVVAHGANLNELESDYSGVAAGEHQHVRTEDEHARTPNTPNYPNFSRLSRCDHEGDTGVLCILDAEEAPNAVKSYYNVGFVR